MPDITPNELKRLFPGASASVIRRNQTYAEGVCAVEPEPVKRKPLVRRVPREGKSGPRARIVFTVFSVRPCDWDGYHIKPIQDMLVHAGLLLEDSWDQLEGCVCSRKVHSREEEKTVIDIFPMTEFLELVK